MRPTIFIVTIFLTACTSETTDSTDKDSVTETHKNTVDTTFEKLVYNIAPEFDNEKCAVYGACDCCSSDLLFIDKTNFIYITYCEGDKSVTRGTYHFDQSNLFLDFDTVCAILEYNYQNEIDTSAVDYFLKSETIKKHQTVLKIDRCKDRALLTLKHENGRPHFLIGGNVGITTIAIISFIS